MRADVFLIPPPRKIGLIGGLAIKAGLFYYERIVRRYASDGRPLELVLAHADVNTVLRHVAEGDRVALGGYLASLANDLFAAGADLVAVTAVAPHLAIAELMEAAQGPIVNVLRSVSVLLEASGLERVAVFGNRAVMETGVFGALAGSALASIGATGLQEVHEAYTEIARSGKRGTEAETRVLERVARFALERSGAQAILLAGTDLSSFYADAPPSYPFLDVAHQHIDDIVRAAWSV